MHAPSDSRGAARSSEWSQNPYKLPGKVPASRFEKSRRRKVRGGILEFTSASAPKENLWSQHQQQRQKHEFVAGPGKKKQWLKLQGKGTNHQPHSLANRGGVGGVGGGVRGAGNVGSNGGVGLLGGGGGSGSNGVSSVGGLSASVRSGRQNMAKSARPSSAQATLKGFRSGRSGGNRNAGDAGLVRGQRSLVVGRGDVSITRIRPASSSSAIRNSRSGRGVSRNIPSLGVSRSRWRG